jgi:hypothetical protein
MRVATNTLTGGGSNEITVIRGVLATKQISHDSGSLIRKIKPIPIEFRRPSIVRASGHTFEYLGYGPGNYSTGLPQVQVITLTEREEFLVQSQERSGGVVVYTGMNNNGDSFIGNRKTSSSTGEEITFDNPIPTVTGEDPSRLSVIFDEVTVKERLVVEGGNSGAVLSQFDGPVTFNKGVKFNDSVNIKAQLKVSDSTQSTSTTNGALVVSGGVGIAKNLNVGGNITGNIVGNLTGTASTATNAINTRVTPDTTNTDRYVTFVSGVTDGFYEQRSSSNLKFNPSSGNVTITSINGFNVSGFSGNRWTNIPTVDSIGVMEIGRYIDFHSTAGDTNNNTYRIDNTSTGNLSFSGNITAVGNVTTNSDEKLKENVITIKNALEKVLSLRGVEYDRIDSGEHQIGLIAQEVEKIIPEVVYGDETKSVAYANLVSLLIEAIKEQQTEINNLNDLINNFIKSIE